jgi:hypothetical protein
VLGFSFLPKIRKSYRLCHAIFSRFFITGPSATPPSNEAHLKGKNNIIYLQQNAGIGHMTGVSVLIVHLC